MRKSDSVFGPETMGVGYGGTGDYPDEMREIMRENTAAIRELMRSAAAQFRVDVCENPAEADAVKEGAPRVRGHVSHSALSGIPH